MFEKGPSRRTRCSGDFAAQRLTVLQVGVSERQIRPVAKRTQFFVEGRDTSEIVEDGRTVVDLAVSDHRDRQIEACVTRPFRLVGPVLQQRNRLIVLATVYQELRLEHAALRLHRTRQRALDILQSAGQLPAGSRAAANLGQEKPRTVAYVRIHVVGEQFLENLGSTQVVPIREV